MAVSFEPGIPTIARFKKELRELGLTLKGRCILVGLSGGADSTCLLGLLWACQAEFGYQLMAVHVNHGLRGRESEADELFARGLCKSLRVSLKVFRLRLAKGSSEAICREQRLACFAKACQAADASMVFLAHHMQDQAETVLFNLLRGAGLKGAGGMRRVAAFPGRDDLRVARPLLGWRKEELMSALRHAAWKWREDKSNQSARYSRNILRNRVFPLLEQAHPGAVKNLAQFAQRAGQASQRLDKAALQTLRQAAVKGRSGAFSLKVLRNLGKQDQKAAFLCLAVSRLKGLHGGPDQGCLGRLLKLIEQGQGQCDLLEGWQAWAGKGVLAFGRPGQGKLVRLKPGEQEVPGYGLWLKLEKVPVHKAWKPEAGAYWFDAAGLKGPFWLRPPKLGERFQPFGLRGSRKVSDLLAEAGVPVWRRGRQAVFSFGPHKEALALCGIRQGARAAIAASSRWAWRLECRPLAEN